MSLDISSGNCRSPGIQWNECHTLVSPMGRLLKYAGVSAEAGIVDAQVVTVKPRFRDTTSSPGFRTSMTYFLLGDDR